MTCTGAGVAVTRPGNEPAPQLRGGAEAGAGAEAAAECAAPSAPADLRERVAHYLRDHHTMTLATFGATGAGASDAAGAGAAGAQDSPAPHAASVFYAVDEALRLVFLSKPTSAHGLHIGAGAAVAVTVTEQYDDWEQIRGVQLWGSAKPLSGAAKVAAMAVYLRRFPFVRDLMEQPRLAASMRKVAVYRVDPRRAAFTDNTTGVFGREVLDLKG
jgi:uncharacterized protein YhbP (UPF0306 family)